MDIICSLNGFFSELLRDLPYGYDTKAYVASVFAKYKAAESFDLSKHNITLTYAQAHFNQDFFVFQNLADWILLCKTLFPGHLHSASEEYYSNIGSLSYYSCYRLINKQWKCYEEIADCLDPLSEEIRARALSVRMTF